MAEQWDYKKAGLDLEKYAETMSGIQPLLTRTWPMNVIRPPFKPAGGKGGGFAALFDLDPNRWLFSRKYKNPVLVSCTDGVGSKLKIAALAGKFDTVGIDLVAMSVNDLICTGGEPLMFLDYIAMPKDDPPLTKALVQGISDGCAESGCALVGGETAILPDFYLPGDFDMAGFAVGVVERDRIVDGTAVQVGDRIVALSSSGVHSNGYSLVRKIVFEAAKLNCHDAGPVPGRSVGEELLTPTRLYVKPLLDVLHHYPVKKNVIRGLANITGGGVPDNLARVLPPGRRAVIKRGTWEMPAVFPWLQKLGNVAPAEMEKVFNMGIGFCVVCSSHFAESIAKQFRAAGVPASVVGDIVAGDAGVEFVG